MAGGNINKYYIEYEWHWDMTSLRLLRYCTNMQELLPPPYYDWCNQRSREAEEDKIKPNN